MIVRFTIKEVQAFASASAIAQEVLQNIRTVTAFHGQEREEQRCEIYNRDLDSISLSIYCRFADTLVDAKKIGIKKGIAVGSCLCASSIFTYAAFAILVWYGPYLVRTDCTNYSAGSVVVVRLIIYPCCE